MNVDQSGSKKHPGYYIKKEVEARGYCQRDLAFVLGMSEQQLNSLLARKGAITAPKAKDLGVALGVSPEIFLNMQSAHSLATTQAVDASVESRAKWQNVFPVREMIRRGWVSDYTDAATFDRQMCRFFGVESPKKALDAEYAKASPVAHAARKTNAMEITAPQLSLVRRVRLMAAAVSCAEYSAERLRSSLDILARLRCLREDVGEVPAILRECGVRFIVVECLPSAKIDGICTWLDDTPVVAITNRYDRLDNFWFVLRHELEHVLRGHGRNDGQPIVDSLDPASGSGDADLSEQEKQANDAAANFCIPRDALNSFICRKGRFVSERDILGFAAYLGIHPSIAVGQYQHAVSNYRFLGRYLAAKVCGVRDVLRATLEGTGQLDGWNSVANVEL